MIAISPDIKIIRPWDKCPDGYVSVSAVSNSTEGWERGLSPFILGPCDLYNGFESKNMENGWQYSKVYKIHVGVLGWPSIYYFDWAKRGWGNPRAVRYPMGKGAAPEYSYWDGKRLSYIEARRQIYIPLYSKAVIRTEAFKILKEMSETNKIALRDYDGYDHMALNMTYEDVINCTTRKMGHAFVLAMLLEGYL